MQTKTLKKIQYRSKANDRVISSWNGAFTMLAFLQRVEGSEIVASQEALDLLSSKWGNF